MLKGLLPELKARWQKRQQRPLPPAVVLAQRHFDQIWATDGSILEALFRKLKVLKDVPIGQLAGKICTVIDITTRLKSGSVSEPEPTTPASFLSC